MRAAAASLLQQALGSLGARSQAAQLRASHCCVQRRGAAGLGGVTLSGGCSGTPSCVCPWHLSIRAERPPFEPHSPATHPPTNEEQSMMEAIPKEDRLDLALGARPRPFSSPNQRRLLSSFAHFQTNPAATLHGAFGVESPLFLPVRDLGAGGAGLPLGLFVSHKAGPCCCRCFPASPPPPQGSRTASRRYFTAQQPRAVRCRMPQTGPRSLQP